MIVVQCVYFVVVFFLLLGVLRHLFMLFVQFITLILPLVHHHQLIHVPIVGHFVHWIFDELPVIYLHHVILRNVRIVFMLLVVWSVDVHFKSIKISQ